MQHDGTTALINKLNEVLDVQRDQAGELNTLTRLFQTQIQGQDRIQEVLREISGRLGEQETKIDSVKTKVKETSDKFDEHEKGHLPSWKLMTVIIGALTGLIKFWGDIVYIVTGGPRGN